MNTPNPKSNFLRVRIAGVLAAAAIWSLFKPKEGLTILLDHVVADEARKRARASPAQAVDTTPTQVEFEAIVDAAQVCLAYIDTTWGESDDLPKPNCQVDLENALDAWSTRVLHPNTSQS